MSARTTTVGDPLTFGDCAMQIIRTFVILFGLAIVVVGLYLLVLGFGAPIEIKSIQLGWVKASLAGKLVGLLVAVVGAGVIYLAARHLKRRERTVRRTKYGPDGRPIEETVEISSMQALFTQIGKD